VAARRPVRSSVLPPSRRPSRLIPAISFPLIRCYLALLPSCLPRRLPAHAGPSRSLCSMMSTRSSARAGLRPRRCPAPCPEKETVGFICQHACPPRHLRLFYELCAYIKSGSSPEGLFPPGPAHSPRSSYSCVRGIRNRVRISWRHGMPTGGQGRSYLTCRGPDLLGESSKVVGGTWQFSASCRFGGIRRSFPLTQCRTDPGAANLV
jgi:hypothetical protein